MKCRFCGTNLPDDARFCSGCGREIERENVSAKEKNNNETEDAYYREIDDKEYEEIKKKKKEHILPNANSSPKNGIHPEISIKNTLMCTIYGIL